ncbi:protein-disulfide isomerase [Rhodoligotrophos appendicifer]|uniref:DsbA family protein n=1 Tax=Rhodoligotrophos appendicifer TaxID=987056 RepID=UPI00195FC96C|nr:DsbA family protein [Rhodoligotrophos appendicifer]
MNFTRRAAMRALSAFSFFMASELFFPINPLRADVETEALLEPGALGDIIIGSDDAPVTIVEYASLTCPHCADFTATTFPELKTKYIDTGKVRFIFREFPFDDLALAAAMISRCMPRDKFFPMIEILFDQQKVWSQNNPREELFNIAKLSGMTQAQFDECLKREDIAKAIIASRSKAAEQFGVDSTPTFFINGKVLKGSQPLSEFDKLIEAAQSE